MTTPSETPEKIETKTVRGTLYETTRLILLASVGAISLAQDEINNFLDRLVERGEMAEADARRLVREVTERRENLEKERRQRVIQAKEARGTAPASVSKADIQALNARIVELTRQIEELRRQQKP